MCRADKRASHPIHRVSSLVAAAPFSSRAEHRQPHTAASGGSGENSHGLRHSGILPEKTLINCFTA